MKLITLLDTCDNIILVISDYENLCNTSKTYIYVCDAHNSTSTTTLFVHSVYSLVTDIHIIDTLPSSDHLPVGLVVSTCVMQTNLTMYLLRKKVLKRLLLLNGLKRMKISRNMETVLLYIWTKYTSQSHLHVHTLIVQTNCIEVTLTNVLMIICVALRESSLEMISTYGKTSCEDYIIPGWNDYIKEAHSEARNCYILTSNMGKPK